MAANAKSTKRPKRHPRSRYAKGRRLEYAAKRALESRGYQVMRTAGSHGPWDLIGVSKELVLFVQVKANRPPSEAEWQRLYAFPCPSGPAVHRAVWVFHDRLGHEELTLAEGPKSLR